MIRKKAKKKIPVRAYPASYRSGDNDAEYAAFERLIADRIASHDGPFFTTDVNPETLWNAYLGGIPTDRRQHYNCNACRRFIQKYGTLVVIRENGLKSSPLWAGAGTVPDFFAISVGNMRRIVECASITGVFYDSEDVWGTPKTYDEKLEWRPVAEVRLVAPRDPTRAKQP